jgi:hypothetical protein
VNIAEQVRSQLPEGGLFAGQEWRVATRAFPLEAKLAKELETLGRVLLQFNRATNLLYRHSVEGKQPAWVAQWLDLGKPQWLIDLQRAPTFKNHWPRVIRPDLLVTDDGIAITELDSVPGGIGVTAWLNGAYGGNVIGGLDGMIAGFASIFGKANRVHIVVSEESATYRPEMQWLCDVINARENGDRFQVRNTMFDEFAPGDAVYRFFELFDTANIPNAQKIFDLAREGKILLTPPPKTIFEEKLLLALLWNRNLREFWRRELGESFFTRMLKITPYSWVIDPAPLPPHGAIPELNLTDWNQLKSLSQKERNLILKVSGFSENAWGSRGVFLGSDLPTEEWTRVVDAAIGNFAQNPHILQRYHKPRTTDFEWHDFAKNAPVTMPGRVRLSPYYFVGGDADAARANLGGILATVVPADKKIVHGMSDSILAPCSPAPLPDGTA